MATSVEGAPACKPECVFREKPEILRTFMDGQYASSDGRFCVDTEAAKVIVAIADALKGRQLSASEAVALCDRVVGQHITDSVAAGMMRAFCRRVLGVKSSQSGRA